MMEEQRILTAVDDEAGPCLQLHVRDAKGSTQARVKAHPCFFIDPVPMVATDTKPGLVFDGREQVDQDLDLFLRSVNLLPDATL